jgi:hypothetical protein
MLPGDELRDLESSQLENNRRGLIAGGAMALAGIVCTAVSIYQLYVLEHAHFYALFSLGTTLLLSAAYSAFSGRHVFHGWGWKRVALYFVLLLVLSVIIDRIGMAAGFWEYPHYDGRDNVRKYIFEWTIALFYHYVALLIGIELIMRAGAEYHTALIVSLLLVVTIVGFVTESLNLQVYSWRVTSMPITNIRIGNYFLVFQTIGYWLMALIPYWLFSFTSSIDRDVVSKRLR